MDTERVNADDDPADSRNESRDQKADRNWNDILQELRVSQTGTQVVSGFLLAIAFQPRFPSLAPDELVLYGVLVALSALATLLGGVTVALHRLTFGSHDKAALVRVGDRLLFATACAVGLLTIGVVTFLFDFVFGLTAGLIAGAAAVVVAAVLVTVLRRRIGARRPGP